MESRVSIIHLIGCVLAAAILVSGLAVSVLAEVKDVPYSLTPVIFDDDSGLLPEKANPVNLSQTRVIWNGRDITDDPILRYTPTLEDE